MDIQRQIAEKQLESLYKAKKGPKKAKKEPPPITVNAGTKRGRPKRAVIKAEHEEAEPKIEVEDEVDVIYDPPHPEPEKPFDVSNVIIEWEEGLDGEPEIVISKSGTDQMQIVSINEQNSTPAEKKVIERKIVWDPDSKSVVRKESEVKTIPTNTSPPNKRKRSEVANLLGDEGVQMIMRDQEICLDSNGTLLNMTKASKTRHQRKKQEEPDKTINDWTECAMIARRRSSSFSTDSFLFPGEQPPLEPTESVLVPPKITNLMKSLKDKMNKTLSDSFDSVAKSRRSDELNNNEISAMDTSLESQASPNKVSPKTKSQVAKRPTPPKKRKIPVNPEHLQIRKEQELVHLKMTKCGGLLSSGACNDLKSVLNEEEFNEDCKLILVGPLKLKQSEAAVTEDEAKVQREFLEALASFPKPIFVAVQGTVEGVGVTMLPLFDLVLGKYGTEFCCAKDPLPGMSILMNSEKVDKNRISELVFLGESMTSTQALNCGLITREISSKSDSDFEEKVVQVAKEFLKANYTKRVSTLKRIWRETHLDRVSEDLRKELSN